MGRWTSLVVEAERREKHANHKVTEPTEGVLSVLSVGDLPVFREFDELRALINAVADHWQFAPDEREEAIRSALNDPWDALTCYRDIATKARLSPKPESSKVH